MSMNKTVSRLAGAFALAAALTPTVAMANHGPSWINCTNGAMTVSLQRNFNDLYTLNYTLNDNTYSISSMMVEDDLDCTFSLPGQTTYGTYSNALSVNCDAVNQDYINIQTGDGRTLSDWVRPLFAVSGQNNLGDVAYSVGEMYDNEWPAPVQVPAYNKQTRTTEYVDFSRQFSARGMTCTYY